IRPTGFDGDAGLFPWPPAASPGLRAVLEYFTLPEKFLFVDVVGLDQAARAAAERFVLEFDLEHAPPPPTRLDRDMVRLGCAPAVNLFPSAAEPLRVDPLRTEQPLIVADLPPTHAEV